MAEFKTSGSLISTGPARKGPGHEKVENEPLSGPSRDIYYCREPTVSAQESTDFCEDAGIMSKSQVAGPGLQERTIAS